MPGPLSFPDPERRLRLGLVGGGQGAFIGAIHAGGARLSGRWDIVAGALSSDRERARSSGRAWMLPDDRIYEDFHEMARREAGRADGIDAVAITVPNHLHRPVADAFMDAGIDIISDKPLTPRLEDALHLVRRQRETGLVFGVTHAYSAYSMVRQARAMIRAGLLGDLRQVHVEYFQEFALDIIAKSGGGLPWRVDPARSGNSFTVADIGTHALHLATFVTSTSLERVRADFHVSGEPKSLEDTAFMQIRLSGGVPGTLMVSQAAAGCQCGLRIRVFGTKGSLEWAQETPDSLDFTEVDSPKRTYSSGFAGGLFPEAQRLARMPRGCPEGIMEAWANLYTEFAVAIEARRSGRPVPADLLAYPTVIDGARGVRFVEASVLSNATGAWEDCRLDI